MPHEWNNIWVVTLDELVPKYFNTLVSLKVSIHRYKDKSYGIKKVQSGGNGRQMLIAYDTLPAHVQEGIPDPRKPAHLMEMFYQTDNDAVRFFTDFRFEDSTYLSLAHQEEYITNASVLKACVLLKAARENERRTKGGSLKGIMSTVCTDAASFNKTLKAKFDVEHTLPLSEKRFKEVFKRFLNEAETGFNYKSLISSKLKNENAKRVTDEVVKLLNDMFAGQGKKPTRTEIARQFDAFLSGYVEVVKNDGTGEMYDPKNFRKLSESTIVNYLGLWENRIGTYSKRSGDRLRDITQFRVSHRFERPKHAGRIISIDDRQPPFKYAPSQRPWFYTGIDLGSEAFTCWVHGKSKEGIIIDFYRQMLRNYTDWGFNLPLELECEMSLNSGFTKTFLQPGAMFDHVRIEANNPRGKRIEAYYRTLRYAHEKDREGWLARPNAKSESNQVGPGKEIYVPFDEIIEGCLRDIEDWNNMPHAVHKDKTRWEVFCEMQTQETKPTNWKAILPHLGYLTQSSCNVGTVRLQKKEFFLGDNGEIYLGDRLINLMKQIEGRNVDVYWLDDNKGGVMKALIYIGDLCICEAIQRPVPPRSITERTAKDNADFELVSAYVATVDGYRNRQRNSIDEVLVIDNREKTLNRKFVMPNISRRETQEPQDAEILEDRTEQQQTEETYTGYSKRLKDRF